MVFNSSIENIKKFIDDYQYIDKRCEEIVKNKYPGKSYSGFSVSNDGLKYTIIVNFYENCYGECDEDYELISFQDLDPNVNLSEKYSKVIEEYNKKIEESRKAKYEKEKELAIITINKLKKNYNIE